MKKVAIIYMCGEEDEVNKNLKYSGDVDSRCLSFDKDEWMIRKEIKPEYPKEISNLLINRAFTYLES